MSAPTSSTKSWRQIVEEADPEWERDRLRPTAYVIPKNGRKFLDRYPLYSGTGT
jgi:hypothetical protein